MTGLLRLSGIDLAYPGGVQALHSIDLDLAAGTRLSVVGPSGCGKSSLLRIIAGLMPASAGTLTWDEPVGRRGIGMVFQEPTLMPWARVLDNVRLPLDLAGVRRADGDARARQQLDAVGLGDFAAAYPRQLSGGMRMRVSLARALVTGPRVLLLDEPFAALDEITRFQLNDDFLRLCRDTGVTAIFVTHSVFEAVYLATRLIVMSPRPGCIIADMGVDLPDERTPDLRMQTRFGVICRQVSSTLMGAMAGDGGRS